MTNWLYGYLKEQYYSIHQKAILKEILFYECKYMNWICQIPKLKLENKNQKLENHQFLISRLLGFFFLLHINDFFLLLSLMFQSQWLIHLYLDKKNVVYRKSGNKPSNQEYMMNIKNNVT